MVMLKETIEAKGLLPRELRQPLLVSEHAVLRHTELRWSQGDPPIGALLQRIHEIKRLLRSAESRPQLYALMQTVVGLTRYQPRPDQ